LPYFFGVRHETISGERFDMGGDLSAGLGVPVWVASVGFMAGLYVPEALRVVWARPALGVVPVVAQRVKRLFMARRGDVQRLARGKLNTGGQRVNMGRAVLFSVQNRTCRILIGIEAGKRGALKILHDLVNLLGGRVVLWRPGDNTGRIAPLVRAGVGNLSHQMRIATQYRYLGAFLTVMVTLT
jgi:hypothetical protein|tara:strand:- start:1728 stop:2279 length:552 start_codon:yes stop_codon:yes gene_type:complete